MYSQYNASMEMGLFLAMSIFNLLHFLIAWTNSLIFYILL